MVQSINFTVSFNFIVNRLLSSILDENGHQERFRKCFRLIQAASDAARLMGPILVMDDVTFHRTESVAEELI